MEQHQGEPGATLDHGLLEIELRRTEPEPQVRTIAISKGTKSAAASALPSATTVRVTAES